MKSVLRFVAWATLAFVVAWFVAHPYQRAIAGVAGRLAAPPGAEIEWVDLEIFFPYDLSVFAALCLASAWVPWNARLRALTLGLAALVVVELATLFVAMRVLLASAGQPAQHADETSRWVTGVIRLTGLVAAGGAWLYLLGWQRLPPFTRGLDSRRSTARGGKP